MLKYLLLSLFLILSFTCFAQTVPVSGKIVDITDNSGLPGATVLIIRLPDSVRTGALVTDTEGVFKVEQKAGRYLLRASFLGFENVQRVITVGKTPLNLGAVGLKLNSKTLNQVEIVERVPTAVQKGDTTEFNAKAMKVNPDANTDELVEKVPGVVIQDGKVTARGQDVKKVRVDGKEFFGDDAMATLKNLPADIVDKIQLVEEQSEQSRLSGVDDGNRTMAMNIVTRPDRRNGLFGRLTAGTGDNARFQTGGTINLFKPKRRITLLAGSNNINQQAFGLEDFLGGGFGGGRGNRSSGGGFGGSGLTTTHNAGINYSEEWGKKITLSGSYFGNHTDNIGFTNNYRNYFQPDFERKSEATGDEDYQRLNTNHRLNARFEYKIDSSNTLFVQPRLSIQMNNGFSNSTDQVFYNNFPVTESSDRITNDLSGYNLGTDLNFRHQFAKRGRSASIGINISANENNSENFSFVDADNYNFKSRKYLFTNTDLLLDKISQGKNFSSSLTFVEPITKTSHLNINYNYGLNHNDSNTRTYDYSELTQAYSIYNPNISNVFNNNSFSHQIGAGYNYFNEKINFNGRLSYQYSELINERLLPVARQIERGFNRFIPFASFNYRFNQNKNIRIFYNGNTQNPSLDQLQDVLDKSNKQNLRLGNPGLNQAYSHFLNLRYTATVPEKSSTFVANITGNLNQNQIVNNRYVNNSDTTIYAIGNFFADTLVNRATLTRFQNLNGNYSLRSFASYSVPVKIIKSNLSFEISADINRNPGLTSPINSSEEKGGPITINTISTYSYAQNYGAGLSLSSNISKNLDFNISTRGFYNNAYNTLPNSIQTTYYNHFNRVRLNWIFYKGFVFNTEFTQRLNTSVVEGADNINYMLLNIAVGKKLFKKQNGDIRLSVYDLFKQNQGLRQNVTANYLEQVESIVLQRYFMLTFTYNIRKFGTGANSGGLQGPGQDGERNRGNWHRESGGDNPRRGNFQGGN